ncbi:RNA polymerase II subunit B1 CTD phosphatase Rpap2 [Microtus ochrogaster]|uniref:RNA polymerase II subunit B1 CTD phosphatase RPAP2 homolog n=1 Tax=Microtus ochrogaster TaxID=79684 RepID=A0A8J6GS05_MICOH|nr:RNA polymerase II subunit B1 CTD phosphatase Rpap2 [Microtus ochrogaster]
MAASAAPHCLGPSARASSTHRKAAGTKQSRVLKPEDASRRRAELEAAVQRKVECERKAVRIVEQLLEENITEEFLKECGMFITPAHYSDVVDERAIIKLCGYPLCLKKLGAIPKQKYKISTKTNKVYDITERKALHTQVAPTLRPPDFQLLKEGQRFVRISLAVLSGQVAGRSGEVVQFLSDAVTPADIDGPGAREAQSEATAPSAWCDHTTDDEQDFVSSLLPGHGPRAADRRPQPHRESSIRKKKAGQKVTSRHREQTVADVTERLGNCRLDGQEKMAACELPSKRENTQTSSPDSSAASDSRHSVSEVTLVGISKKSAEHFRVKFAKSNQGSGPASGPGQGPEVAKASLLRVLKDTLTEWKTEETLKFLYGPDLASVCPKLPSAPIADEELDEDDLSCDPASCGPAVSQPQNNLDETLPFRGSDTATKPLPSYENLKKETEMLNLWVREFYRGLYVLNEETTKSQDPGENGFQCDTSFPLIDSSSQIQIRRRIVLEKLSKVLPGLLGPLQITIGDIYSELKSLVQTFSLTPILGIQKHSPKNVVFTQFIATLLTELHLKCEDLENLTTVFRTSF